MEEGCEGQCSNALAALVVDAVNVLVDKPAAE
jgi:hypothetical protein